MTEMPKVLVASPIYEDKEYIRKRWVQQIKNLDYPNYDYLLVDNSKTLDYTRRLKREGVRIVHVNRGDNSRDAIATSMNLIRKKVIDGHYDYLMSIESDLIPPKDIIQRLMRHNKPVVGSIYLIGFANDPKQPQRACLFQTKMNEKGMMETYNCTPQESLAMMNTGLQPCHGTGLGCTLIKKYILDTYKFWYDPRFTNKHPDVYFFMQLHNDGVQAYVDTDIHVYHQPSRWTKVKDM